jgi:hypothetical protein
MYLRHAPEPHVLLFKVSLGRPSFGSSFAGDNINSERHADLESFPHSETRITTSNILLSENEVSNLELRAQPDRIPG